MNKLFTFFGLLFLFCTIAFGQKTDFDIKDFSQKAQTAEWLCQYDAVAWWTSDSVMKGDSIEISRIGPEWFCFQSYDKLWHAVYGKFSQNKYDLVFHYIVDSTNKVKRVYQPVDEQILNSYSKALITANSEIKAIKDSFKIRFNQYIRENEDHTFTVWIFPAFQTDNHAVYGGEFIYEINKDGTEIIKDNSYYQGQFRAFKVSNPREIWMNYSELEKPTLGTVFFVWYYKKYFTKINIENKYYVTCAFKNVDGTYSWMHIERETK